MFILQFKNNGLHFINYISAWHFECQLNVHINSINLTRTEHAENTHSVRQLMFQVNEYSSEVALTTIIC